MRAIGDRIIITRDKEPEKVGSFYIPDNNKEKPSRGVVRFVGEVVTQIEVGETVLFSKYAGTEMEVGAEKYVVLNRDEVLAVL